MTKKEGEMEHDRMIIGANVGQKRRSGKKRTNTGVGVGGWGVGGSTQF
jgi:hypothetical protein